MSALRDLVAEELSTPGRSESDRDGRGDCGQAWGRIAGCSLLRLGLRQKQLQGLMLDFYLIVSDYRSAYAKRWLATANRLIPPNVFYIEHDGLVAKYAVLSEGTSIGSTGPKLATSRSGSFRPAIPPGRAADDEARRNAASSIARAAQRCLRPRVNARERPR